MAKTVTFWPGWQPFTSFCFESLTFSPLFPFFLFDTQKKRGGGMAGAGPPSIVGPAKKNKAIVYLFEMCLNQSITHLLFFHCFTCVDVIMLLFILPKIFYQKYVWFWWINQSTFYFIWKIVFMIFYCYKASFVLIHSVQSSMLNSTATHFALLSISLVFGKLDFVYVPVTFCVRSFSYSILFSKNIFHDLSAGTNIFLLIYLIFLLIYLMSFCNCVWKSLVAFLNVSKSSEVNRFQN